MVSSGRQGKNAEKEKLRAQIETMKEILGPYIRKSDELRNAAPPSNNPEETELFYSQQTYLHTVYLDRVKTNLASFEPQFTEPTSEFETTLKIESDTKSSSH